MPILAFIAFMGLAFGLDYFSMLRGMEAHENTSKRVEAVAYNMGVYEEGVRRYVRSNLSTVGAGVITDNDINAYLPTTYRKMENWYAQRNAAGYILVSLAPGATLTNPTAEGNIANALQRLRDNPLGIGVMQSGRIISGLYPTEPITSPIAAPEGSVVILTYEE